MDPFNKHLSSPMQNKLTPTDASKSIIPVQHPAQIFPIKSSTVYDISQLCRSGIWRELSQMFFLFHLALTEVTWWNSTLRRAGLEGPITTSIMCLKHWWQQQKAWDQLELLNGTQDLSSIVISGYSELLYVSPNSKRGSRRQSQQLVQHCFYYCILSAKTKLIQVQNECQIIV